VESFGCDAFTQAELKAADETGALPPNSFSYFGGIASIPAIAFTSPVGIDSLALLLRFRDGSGQMAAARRLVEILTGTGSLHPHAG
jgi:hypothetical protein